MLCLTRKTGQSIVITVPPSAEAREIRVMVADTLMGRARLGVTADTDIRVDRDEVHARIQAEKLP